MRRFARATEHDRCTPEEERTRKMEQIPQWLTNAVNAAGMTAYAEGLEPKHLKRAPLSEESAVDEMPILPLH